MLKESCACGSGSFHKLSWEGTKGIRAEFEEISEREFDDVVGDVQ